MQIPKNTLTTESVAFKTVPDAVKALQNTKTLTVDVREIITSTDIQNLIRHLNALKRPFGVCVVRSKES